ncbi:MAG: hypothetical protein JO341_09740 [Gammaproteobacteria bacterium]|nr:hypothetical protein [Gammaproteobacteria bacterium]MBV9621291.1 hypothetical protein [Gammaproteobacteria bacterium]
MATTATADPVVKSAARWFWWIAGLSLVNLVLLHSGSNTNFVVGLAMTMLASGLFAGNPPVALALAALTIGFYLLVGFYAERQRLWAFYLGLALYLLDGLLYLYFQDWMPVAFHAFVAYCICRGILRMRALARDAAAAPTAG